MCIQTGFLTKVLGFNPTGPINENTNTCFSVPTAFRSYLVSSKQDIYY